MLRICRDTGEAALIVADMAEHIASASISHDAVANPAWYVAACGDDGWRRMTRVKEGESKIIIGISRSCSSCLKLERKHIS